jgi:hypothetical protein
MKRHILACGLAGVLTAGAATGCSDGGAPPTAPSIAGGNGTTEAAPDGSTLKVTPATLQSPIGGTRLNGLKPTLLVRQSRGKFASGAFQYRIEVTTATGTVVHSATVSPSSDTFSYSGTPDLLLDTRYRWRVRPEMAGSLGPWTSYEEFLTIDYRGIVPRPPDGRWPSDGPAVVAYVAQSFPHLLRATPTDDERIENMKYLRDRIIETGICGGMDLGWNMKRGTPELSVDAITYRGPDGLEIFDLASGYDDHDYPLHLWWFPTTFPFYKAYENHPGC